MRFCGAFSTLRAAPTRETAAAAAPRRARARPLRPPRGRRRRPPSGTSSPASRSASTASTAAPPEVTTSSTRQTRSPASKTPSSRFAVPYSFASLRTIRNGRPDASEAAAASGDRAELGPGEPHRVRLVLGDRRGDPLAERPEQLGPRLEAVLVEVVARAPARAEDEVALEVGVLAERRARARRRVTALRAAERRRARAEAAARPRASPRERDHRAVVVVEVDALAPAGRAPAQSSDPRRSRRRARCRQRALRARIALRRVGCLRFGRARFGFGVASAAEPAQAALQVVEDEADRRLGAVVAAIRRSPSRTTKTLPLERRRLELRERRRSPRRAARPPRAAPAPRRRAVRARVVGERRGEHRAVARRAATAASIWDEISVRSASACGRVHAADANTASHTPRRGCARRMRELVPEVLRRPRHAPRGDDRLLRAALVRAAALPRALAARRSPGGPTSRATSSRS